MSGGLPPGASGAVTFVAARPRLWRSALRQARVLVPGGWWRRPPFLPLPDRAWLGFRLTTAYGGHTPRLDAGDLQTWLDWSESMRPFLRPGPAEADRIPAQAGGGQG